jgi:hypothetical protein
VTPMITLHFWDSAEPIAIDPEQIESVHENDYAVTSYVTIRRTGVKTKAGEFWHVREPAALVREMIERSRP